MEENHHATTKQPLAHQFQRKARQLWNLNCWRRKRWYYVSSVKREKHLVQLSCVQFYLFMSSLLYIKYINAKEKNMLFQCTSLSLTGLACTNPWGSMQLLEGTSHHHNHLLQQRAIENQRVHTCKLWIVHNPIRHQTCTAQGKNINRLPHLKSEPSLISKAIQVTAAAIGMEKLQENINLGVSTDMFQHNFLGKTIWNETPLEHLHISCHEFE